MIRLIVIFMVATMVFAQNLTILNGDPIADIYVDGVFVGKQDVRNLIVEPGTHVIKINKRGTVVYSKSIEVGYGQSQTIDTVRFVDVPLSTAMPNRGPKEEEALRVREARGDVGLGGFVGPVGSGLSFRYYLMRDWGLQVAGWWSATPKGHFKSLLVRPTFVLVNTLSMGKPMTLYTGFGLGRQTESNLIGDTIRTQEELFLGLEFPAVLLGAPLAFLGNAGRYSTSRSTSETAGWMGFGGAIMSLFDNAYAHIDVGIERLTLNQALEYEGVFFSGGVHFFF